MTNEDLLAQAKDQVAKEIGYKSLNEINYDPYDKYTIYQNGNMPIYLTKAELCDRAALLAIQRAREEAFKEGYENRKKYGHLHDCSEAAKSTTKLTDYPECHRCGEPCAGTYEIKGIKFPTCYSCARGLSDD